MAFKVQKTENTGIVYADPANPDHTVRVKHTQAAKVIAGLQVVNQITEIIVNEDYSYTIGSATVVDPLSIRIRISGSQGATARKKALLVAARATLDAWEDEDVLLGFNPTTVPVMPV